MEITTRPSRVGHPEWKWEFPTGFILICDTRENDMLFKRPTKGLVIVRDKLDEGDYSIRGFEKNITVERKNVMDLFQSVGKERDTFKARLGRMAQMEKAFLLIEGSEDEVLSYQPYSNLHPNVVRGFLASLEVKTPIKIHFAETRKGAERYVLDTLLKYYKWKRSG